MIEINEKFALLKKYTHKDVDVLRRDLDKDFSIFVLNRTSSDQVQYERAVSLQQLDLNFSDDKRCYGYYSRPVPLRFTVSMHHDDLAKQLLVFDIQLNATFHPDNKLANLVALIPEKEVWTISDFNKYFSSRLENDLKGWLFERTADMNLHNLLELQDAAFLGDDGKYAFNHASFVPSYATFECVKIGVTREAELSAQEKAYNKKAHELVMKAVEKGISPDVVNEIICTTSILSEAEKMLNELAIAVQISDEYCVKLDIVRDLMEKCPGINDVKRILKDQVHGTTDEERFIDLAKWVSEVTSLSYEYAKRMIQSYPDVRRAEEAAKDYILRFKKILEFKEKFGLESFSAAEKEVERCGGWKKAFKKWESKRKSGVIKGFFLLVVIAVVAFFGVRLFTSNYHEFTFRITNCDPIEIENIVRKHTSVFSYDAASGTYKFSTLISKKAKFIDELNAAGYQVTASEKDAAAYTVSAVFNKYSMRFVTNSSSEFEKVKGWLAANKNIVLVDAQLNESGFGIKIGSFKIDSTIRDAGELKEILVAGIRTVCPGLKEKDITVSIKK